MRKKKVIEPIIEEKPKIEETRVELEEYYILGIGETLQDVAKKFNLDEAKLKEINGEVFGTNQIKLK